MTVTITWDTKVINVPKDDLTLIQSSPVEIREMDINWFHQTLRELEYSEEGIPFLPTHNHVAPIDVGGLTLARVVELINGYTVTFEDGQYAINITGGNSNIGDNVNVNQVSVRSYNSAGLVTSAGIESLEYDNMVWVDTASAYSGTLYPVGTSRRPVNNLSDAKLIADVRGFVKLKLLNSMTIDSGINFSGFTFIGESQIDTIITISDAAEVYNVSIENCNVQGTLDGGTKIYDCWVGNLTYMYGEIRNSGLYGTIILGGSEEAVLSNCYTIDQDSPPIIDMGGSGQDLAMPNYSGIVTIKNLSSDTEEIGVGLNAGQVILDSTISAGTIIIAGNGLLNDYTTGTANVNSDGLMNTVTIANAVWDESLSSHNTIGTVGEIMNIIEKIHVNKMIWDSDNSRFELYNSSDVLSGYLNVTQASDNTLQRSTRVELL